MVSALLRPCSLALANFERARSGIEASHLFVARVVYRDRAIPPLHIPRLRSSFASAVDAPNLLLRQAELPSSPLARRATDPSLPLVGPFRLPLLLERERLASHPDSTLLGALAEPGRVVARLGSFQVGGVLTLAEQARRVLRQGRVALERFRGGDRELAQEVGEGGGPARRERLDQRREVRVEFRQLPVSNERVSAVLHVYGVNSQRMRDARLFHLLLCLLLEGCSALDVSGCELGLLPRRLSSDVLDVGRIRHRSLDVQVLDFASLFAIICSSVTSPSLQVREREEDAP